MSLVVVAWKPHSANAVAAASRMRRGPAGKWYSPKSRSRASDVRAAVSAVSAATASAAAGAASAPAVAPGSGSACGAASSFTAWVPLSCEQYRIRAISGLADSGIPTYGPDQALGKCRALVSRKVVSMKRWIPTKPSASQPHARRPGRRVAVCAAAAAAACLSAAAFAVPAAHAAAPPASGCAAVNLIVARASTEAPGEGTTQSLATQIVNSSTQTVSQEAVVYPATLTNYTSSESQGVTNAEQELTTAVGNCPNQKEVLLGYSQGAEVSMDVIAGNSETGGTVAPVSTAISSHVVAVANFGDPGHVVGQSWDLGTATRAGLFPRSSAQLKDRKSVV